MLTIPTQKKQFLIVADRGRSILNVLSSNTQDMSIVSNSGPIELNIGHTDLLLMNIDTSGRRNPTDMRSTRI